MCGLYGGEGGVGVGVNDVLLSDGVAGQPGGQGGLLLLGAVSEGEGHHVDAAGNILEVPGPHPEEGSDDPAADSGS